MSDVVDMAAYRERRAWEKLMESVRSGVDWPEPQPTNRSQRIELEGFEPTYEIHDETHLFTDGNWLDAKRIIDEIASRAVVSPARRVWLNSVMATPTPPQPFPEADLQPYLDVIDEQVRELAAMWEIPADRLRILPGTDHGSDDGDAESHQGDAG